MFIKNNQCHVANSKIAPPNNGPIILEIPQTLPTIPIILYLNGISNANFGTI